jgi:hypothetical protein
MHESLSSLALSLFLLSQNLLQNTRKESAAISSEISRAYKVPSDFEQFLLQWGENVPAPKLPFEDISKKSDQVTLLVAVDLCSFACGCVYGRWDIRLSIKPDLCPRLPKPSDPLPAIPANALVSPDGLLATPGNIVSVEWLRARPSANTLPPYGSIKNPTIPDTEYPLRISWDGVLVDDPGFNGDRPHRGDIVRRVREVFDLLWKDKAHEIEQEACDILGVSDMRYYFRKPAGFFQDHLKRYSKSRRKAPIYWPLSTESGSYTLWVYYHRLTDQTLFDCVDDYVDFKIKDILNEIEWTKRDLERGGSAKFRGHLEKLMDFHQELMDFRTELLRVAKLPYKPNLNDGVLITAAPLWRLFRHKPWQMELKGCWEKLKTGEYDWAHMAYSIWPDRVRERCKADLSIAIAHGLEGICEVEVPKKGKNRKNKGEPAA